MTGMDMIIKGTSKTPTVKLNREEGTLFFSGRSIPENTFDFYAPINDWIDDYCESPSKLTVISIRLEYFNTSSSKCLLDVFKKLENIQTEELQVLVNWYFETEDEDMQEAGEDYRAIVSLPFEIIEVDEL